LFCGDHPEILLRFRRSQEFLAFRRSQEASQSGGGVMIRKLKSGEYRLYSRKIDPRAGRRRDLGTFSTREAAERHERAVQFFKRRGR
jgi:hypothetical protein